MEPVRRLGREFNSYSRGPLPIPLPLALEVLFEISLGSRFAIVQKEQGD